MNNKLKSEVYSTLKFNHSLNCAINILKREPDIDTLAVLCIKVIHELPIKYLYSYEAVKRAWDTYKSYTITTLYDFNKVYLTNGGIIKTTGNMS